MTKALVTDWRTTVIAILGFIILKYKDINSAFVILAGAVLGYLLWFI